MDEIFLQKEKDSKIKQGIHNCASGVDLNYRPPD